MKYVEPACPLPRYCIAETVHDPEVAPENSWTASVDDCAMPEIISERSLSYATELLTRPATLEALSHPFHPSTPCKRWPGEYASKSAKNPACAPAPATTIPTEAMMVRVMFISRAPPMVRFRMPPRHDSGNNPSSS